MSRTLGELELGTIVYISENSVSTPYILLRKDTETCVMLRKYCYDSRHMNSTNSAIYDGCEMDVWLNNETSGFLSLFDSDTLSCIKSRDISTFEFGDSSCTYIQRKAFLLTDGELFNASPTATEPEGTCLPALMVAFNSADSNTARIGRDSAEGAVNWWLRSSRNYASQFACVYANGTLSNNYATVTYWSRPALNVASDTIVSPEGAQQIVLIPNPQGYNEVEFSIEMGESVNRPSKAVVKFNTSDLTNVSVMVTNNYGDVSPVWVAAPDGSEVNLANETKETENWVVGVKCYGRSTGRGYFEEPKVYFLEG